MSAYSQEYGYFWNSISSDRTYNADSFETWLKKFFLSGVFQGDLQVKAQTTPDMTVNVLPGYANLDGKPAYWSGTNVMQLSAASGVYNRIDTIVLRRDNTNRSISIEVVTGTAALSPQPTPPTRDADIYELVLAQILVGVGVTSIGQAAITDTRMDSDLCGYVAATVDQIDFDQIKAQFDAWMIDNETDFDDWFQHLHDELDEHQAAHLQNQIDAITGEIGSTALPTTAQTLTGAVNELYGNISDLADAIGIVVDGDQAAVSATIGQYIILRHSTITDCTDGLYTAAKAIPSNTAIDKTYLTSVSGGGFNALNSKIDDSLAGYRFTQFGGSGGEIVTLTVPDSLRAWALCNGGNSNMRGIFTFTTTSGGTPNQTILGGNPSGYTFDNTTNNKIKITFANPCECVIIHGADKQITVS